MKDNGYTGIGLTNPAGLFDVKGKIFQNNVQTVYNAGAIGVPNYGGSLFLGNGGNALTAGAIRNTGVGINALNANTGGTNNTAAGYNAMAATTTGTFNTATGSSALAANLTGARNTATGAFALASDTGSDNTGIGANALRSNTTGAENTALGSSALFSNTTISRGVAVGFESQSNVMIPTISATNFNTSIGYQALKGSATPANNIGNNNTAIGYQTMTAYTTANNNVAVGFNALNAATDAVSNTAIGGNALEKATSATYNTAIGRNALGNTTTSSYNIGLGYNAGLDLTTATTGQNTFIGYNTGRGITTGSNNTILGSNVTGLTATLNNNIILADGAGNRRINVDASGKTGIGTISPTARLSVLDSSSVAYFQIADFFAPANTTTGNNTLIKLGVAAAASNSTEIRFNYQGDGSASNRLDFGFHGAVAPRVSILAGGNVGVGTIAPTSQLDIAPTGVANAGLRVRNMSNSKDMETSVIAYTANNNAPVWIDNSGYVYKKYNPVLTNANAISFDSTYTINGSGSGNAVSIIGLNNGSIVRFQLYIGVFALGATNVGANLYADVTYGFGGTKFRVSAYGSETGGGGTSSNALTISGEGTNTLTFNFANGADFVLANIGGTEAGPLVMYYTTGNTTASINVEIFQTFRSR